MIYLILGEDPIVKDQKILQLKEEFFQSPEALNFDYDQLDAVKLDSHELKKSLVSLPAVSPKKVILIRRINKLDKHNKELILEFIQEKNKHTVLILEGESPQEKDSFIEKISLSAKVFRLQDEAKLNVFEMTKLMEQKRPAEALKALSHLISQGDHPLQIMGVLVWFWAKAKNRLSPQKFEEGLEELQETDLNIKRSRLKPEYAIEMLVAKLCLLLI